MKAYASTDFSPPGTPRVYPPDLELEPVHMLLDLAIDVLGRTLSGSVTHTVEARVAGTHTLVLHAVDLRDVAVRDAAGAALSSQYDGRELTVRWDAPFARDERRDLVVSYRVTEPSSGLYFSSPDASYPDRAPWAGTDHETERARHWLPCIDLPNVRTTLEFRLRTNAAYTVLANGYAAGTVDHADGTRTTLWKLDERCPSYLLCFTVGEFVRADHASVGEVPVASFTTREYGPAHLERSFGRTSEMLAWLPRRLGMPFPWPKYYQFALPNFGGAMENISLVSWDDQFVADAGLAAEWGWRIDKINLHEMAHTWFGDAVVCRDYAHAWLKESWAVYIEQCWLEDTAGADEAQYDFLCNATAYIKEADTRYSRPIITRQFESSWDLYDRHLYPGGACRLHTLRMELGDAVFWAATSDYLNTFNGKVVETSDFQRVVEKHSGRSLGRFFDQWFATAGYPQILVTFKHDATRGVGVFEVVQQQAAPPAGPGPFALRTTLDWWIGGTRHSLDVHLVQPRHTFTVPMASDPEMVGFDADTRVLARLEFDPGVVRLLRQLSDAPDVIGRSLAARELAKNASHRAVDGLTAAAGTEGFWGARIEIARALETAGTAAAVAALAARVEAESDPRVIEAVIRAAGTFRDAGVNGALQRRLARGDLGPRAVMAAYEALGAQRSAAPWDELVRAATTPSFGAWAQGGALRGLAATRRPEAAELLLTLLPYGKAPHRVRPALAGALAACVEWAEKPLQKRVAEALIDALRDPHLPVRKAAAAGLAAAGLREGCAPMEAFAASLSLQERLAVERLVKGLRATDDPKVAGLQKQVEALQDQSRKLEERLRALESEKRG